MVTQESGLNLKEWLDHSVAALRCCVAIAAAIVCISDSARMNDVN